MMLPGDVSWSLHPHQGKADLLGKLEGRLRGYARWLPLDWVIVVLVDRDAGDCHKLKARLDGAARSAGLRTLSESSRPSRVQIANRIAIEELEAWFFGDVNALCESYPGVPSTLGQRARYRNSDGIKGGTWEALERVLKTAGYHKGGLQKIEAARSISTKMDPARNRSRSFQHFRSALQRLTASATSSSQSR